MDIRVNPKPACPRPGISCRTAEHFKQTFDYPATGPSDIRSLGVPATAKLEDQLPEQM